MLTPLKTFTALCLTLAFMTPAVAQETTQTLTEDDRSGIRITIYNGNLAAVSETRGLSLGAGLNRIEFADVSAQIQPETALLKGGDFQFIEQNFDYDLLTPQKLIEKAVGRTVMIERTNPATGRVAMEEATVLSVNNGIVLQFDDAIEIFSQGGLPERFVFSDIPENLRAKPTLSTLVNAGSDFAGDVNLSYLTGGFTWKADYVGSLSDDESEIDIQAWITLTNNSGTDFSDVKLQLLAGEVNRVQDMEFFMEAAFASDTMKASAPPPPEALGDYHLYTVPHATDLRNNQTKQVALFSADDVPVEKFYVFDSVGQTQKFQPVKVYYEFDNSDENNLGLPIPAGIFRVYASDQGGDSQFIGESAVPNTPEDQRIILQPGNAFDVTVEEKQTSFQRRDISQKSGTSQYEYTTGKEVTIKNAKDEAVTVRFFENYLRGNWEITRESQSHIQDDAQTIYWEVAVPAKGEAVLSYTKRTW